MMKNGVYFNCDSNLGCRVIQDFDLCKLDDLSHYDKMMQNHKKWNISEDFFLIETLYSCQTHHKVS